MTFEKIKRILCDNFEIEENEVSLDASLLNDLDIDELDFWDLVMDIEDVFNVEITDEAVEDIKTVGDLVKFIDENN